MSTHLRRAALRGAAALGIAATVALAGAAPALAHVTAQPGTAEQGGYGVVTFRVPNESDTAGTVALTVTLPTDHPITSVRTTPVPGWTATTTKVALDPPLQRHSRTVTETVGTVTWTAVPGTRIGPGEYLDLPLSLGPLPDDVDRIVLPASQTYDDGTVVAWDEPPVDGAEPERPAPVVELTPATGDGHGGDDHAAPTASGPAGGTDQTARWLAGGGLLVGALGLGLGGGTALRNRRAVK